MGQLVLRSGVLCSHTCRPRPRVACQSSISRLPPASFDRISRATSHVRFVVRWSGSSAKITCPRLKALHAGPSDAVDQLSEQIRVFERERDDATKTAETLAKTSVKLLEMIELLDKLALEKVTDGDDDAARNILKEKEEVSLMLAKTKTRAENNFALAAKLAEAIGQKQAELVSALPSATRPELEAPNSPDTAYQPNTTSSSSQPDAPPSGYRIKAKWETSLEEARARLQSAEQVANTEARLAVLSAEDSIAAALSRIEQQKEDIMVHRDRLRRTAEQSILEAKERLKKQEEEALDEIKWLMRRYRNGEYIPDYQLDSAFDKLQRRMYK